MSPPPAALLAVLLAVAPGVRASDGPTATTALGGVPWMLDADTARARSAESGRPLVVVEAAPRGAADGAGVLNGGSDPLLVEALRELVVPLLLQAEAPLGDAQRADGPAPPPTLERPRPDGPQAHDPEGAATPHAPEDDPAALARLVTGALNDAQRPVPAWLELVAQGSQAADAQTTTLVTTCFWEGQAHYGGLRHVVDVRVAWRGGHEVVEVDHLPGLPVATLLDPDVAPACLRGLVAGAPDAAAAAEARRLPVLPDHGARPARPEDRLHALRGSPLRALPLTRLQALRVNAALAHAASSSAHLPHGVARWCTPRQLALAETLWALGFARASRLGGPEQIGPGGDIAQACEQLNHRVTLLDG